MILTGLLINETEVFGLDVNGEDIGQNAPAKFENAPTSGYKDLSSGHNGVKYLVIMDKIGLSTESPYSVVRNEVKSQVLEQALPDFSNWENGLDDDEKAVAAKWVVAPYAMRMGVTTDEEDKQNYREVIENTYYDRNNQYHKGKHLVTDYIRKELFSLEQANQFFIDCETSMVRYRESANPEFITWLTTEFENQPYYIESMKNELIDIFVNFNY